MGCGSSSSATSPRGHLTAVAPPIPSTGHPNTSLVLGSDGTASARARRLKEKPRKGSLTFGEELKEIEKEKAEERRKEKEAERIMAAALAQAMNTAANASSSDDDDDFRLRPNQHRHGHDSGDVNPLSPGPSPQPSPKAGLSYTNGIHVDGDTDGDTSGGTSSGTDDEIEDEDSSSLSSSDDENESMEEIEEETMEPVDDGLNGMVATPMAHPTRTTTTLHAAPSTLRTNPIFQRGSSLTNLVKNFSPENAHILVVDDDAQHMEVVAKWLAYKRYHVTLCNDGEEAVEVLSASFRDDEGVAPDPDSSDPNAQQAEDFDLILSELSMESPEGTPLLDWVLRNEKTKHIPFVLMSSDASTQSCDRSLRRGAEDFFIKPLQRNVLLKSLRTILEQRIEQRNSARLKEWGDKYKRQLMAEKKKKEGLGLLVPHTLSPYASLSAMDPPSPLSPNSKHATATASNSPVQLAASSTDTEPCVQPHPELIRNSSRRQLSINVPFDNISTALTPQLTGTSSSLVIPTPSAWNLNGPPSASSQSSTNSNPHTDGPLFTGEEEKAIVMEATVLLIDPSNSTRESLSNWLASINYTLLVQPTMEDALEFLKKTSSARSTLVRAATFAPDDSNTPNTNASQPITKTSTMYTLGSITEPHSVLDHEVAGATLAATSPSPSLNVSPAMTSQTLMTRAMTNGPLAAVPPTTQRSATTNFAGRKGSFKNLHHASPSLGPTAPPTLAVNGTSDTLHRPHRSLAGRSTSSDRFATGVDLIIADAEPYGEHQEGISMTMTGSAFISAIQANSLTKSIPVILMYHNSTGTDVAESIRFGVETILTKPVSKDMLLKKVNQVLTTIAQKKKSDMYAERAQAYRSILTAFRAHREEEVRTGKRSMTPLQRKLSMQSLHASNNSMSGIGGVKSERDSPIGTKGKLKASSRATTSPEFGAGFAGSPGSGSHRPMNSSSIMAAMEEEKALELANLEDTVPATAVTTDTTNGTPLDAAAATPTNIAVTTDSQSQPGQRRSTSNTFTFDVNPNDSSAATIPPPPIPPPEVKPQPIAPAVVALPPKMLLPQITNSGRNSPAATPKSAVPSAVMPTAPSTVVLPVIRAAAPNVTVDPTLPSTTFVPTPPPSTTTTTAATSATAPSPTLTATSPTPPNLPRAPSGSSIHRIHVRNRSAHVGNVTNGDASHDLTQPNYRRMTSEGTPPNTSPVASTNLGIGSYSDVSRSQLMVQDDALASLTRSGRIKFKIIKDSPSPKTAALTAAH